MNIISNNSTIILLIRTIVICHVILKIQCTKATNPSRRDAVHLFGQSVFIYLISNSFQLQTTVRKVVLLQHVAGRRIGRCRCGRWRHWHRSRTICEANFWFFTHQIQWKVRWIFLWQILRYILTRWLRYRYIWDGRNVCWCCRRGWGRRWCSIVGQIVGFRRQGCTGRRGRLTGRRWTVRFQWIQCEIFKNFTWKHKTTKILNKIFRKMPPIVIIIIIIIKNGFLLLIFLKVLFVNAS